MVRAGAADGSIVPHVTSMRFVGPPARRCAMMTRVNPVLVRPARGATARAAASAAEITSASCFAHWCAGGALPSLPWVAGCAALLFAVGLGFQRGIVTFRWAFLGASAGQLLMHLCLQSTTQAAHVHDGASWPMVVAHVAGAVATVVVWTIRRRIWDVLVRVESSRPFVFGTVRALSERPAGLCGIEGWIGWRHRGPPVGC